MIVNDKILSTLPIDVVNDYRHWAAYMRDNISFSLKSSPIHTKDHAERVLLHALLIANEMREQLPQDAATVLAHCAVFHDTRRHDDWLDVGHGARAAAHYKEYAASHPEVEFHPEAFLAMAYHDRDDNDGVEAITSKMGEHAQQAMLIYQIFKDSDALDRFRLSEDGLDPRYLRTQPARHMVDFAHKLVKETSQD